MSNKFLYDNLFGFGDTYNIENHQTGFEARNILNDKAMKIYNSDFFIADKTLMESSCIFCFTKSQDETLEVYRDFITRKSKYLVPRLKNYYLDKFLIIRGVVAQTLRTNLNTPLQTARAKKKEYKLGNITNLPNNINTQFSTIMDMSFIHNLFYGATALKRIPLSPKIRNNMREYFLSMIKGVDDKFKGAPYKNKILYFRGPILQGTSIKLILSEAHLKKYFHPAFLFLEIAFRDIDEFKQLLINYNLSLVFDPGNGKSFIISKNSSIMNTPNFNPRYFMKMINFCEGKSEVEIDGLEMETIQEQSGKSIEELELLSEQNKVESTDIENFTPVLSDDKTNDDNRPEIIDDETLDALFSDKEEYDDGDDEENRIIDNFNDIKEVDNTISDQLTEDIIDIELEDDDTLPETIDSSIVLKPSMKDKDYLEIIDDPNMSEVEKVDAILENHNYANLRDTLETKEVKDMRKKLAKKYGRPLDEVVNIMKKHTLPTTHYDIGIKNGYSKSSFTNYEKSYIDNLRDADLENIVASPSKHSNPLFPISIKRTPKESVEFYGETLEVTYENVRGETFDVVLDIPKVKDGKLYFGGSFKELAKQDVGKPIYKVGSNVIINTAYKKCICSLSGKYGSYEQKALVAILKNFEDTCLRRKTTSELGDFIFKNMCSYNLIHIQRHYAGIGTKNINLDFKGIRLREDNEDAKHITPNFKTVLGHIDGALVYHDPEHDSYAWYHNELHQYNSTQEFILGVCNYINPEAMKKAMRVKTSGLSTTGINRVVATILKRDIPIVLMMLVAEPLNKLLKRLKEDNGLEYKIIKNREGDDLSKYKNNSSYGVVRLKNYTILLKYNNKLNEIILVPLTEFDLTDYETFDITKLMFNMFGSSNTATYLENFVESFFNDAMTERMLTLYNIPIDFVGALIYACSLFISHKTFNKSDSRNFRLITASEIINRCLYDVLITEITNNTNRVKMGSNDRIVIPRDALIKRIQELPNLKESARFNPLRAHTEDHKKSFKGHFGINLSRAYDKETRSMNDHNIGTETMHTPYSGEVGITKTLPVNPVINDLTGAYSPLEGEAAENADMSQVLSSVEGYVPYLCNDHVHRIMMTPTQFAGHAMPIEHSDPMLLSSGFDESIVYQTPDFAYIAKEQGTVLELTDKHIKIQYTKDKSITVISLDNIIRNTDKGYFLKNDWVAEDSLKAGKKFAKGDLLAYNKNFYKKKSNGKVGLSIGCLAFVMITDGEMTWEDSTCIFESLSKKMSSKVLKPISKVIDINSEIRDYNIKLGSEVEADTNLYSFKTLTEDIGLNEYFVGAEDLDLHEVHAKYKGRIVGIEVFFRSSREKEMSKSLSKFMRDVSREIDHYDNTSILNDVTSDFDKALMNKKPRELKQGAFSKMYGHRIENGQCLITYFIETIEELGPADKMVFDRALKGEPCNILPDSQRPIGVESGRKVDAMMETYSFLARQTPGMMMHGVMLSCLFYIAIRVRKQLGIPIEEDSILNYNPSRKPIKQL